MAGRMEVGRHSQPAHSPRRPDVSLVAREELVTERYPELAAVGDALPEGTVIDGEILPFKDGHVLPFTMLQKRIGRKAVTKSILSQVPVIIMAFDLLEHAGADLRPVSARRAPRAPCRHHLEPGTRVSRSGLPSPALARDCGRHHGPSLPTTRPPAASTRPRA